MVEVLTTTPSRRKTMPTAPSSPANGRGPSQAFAREPAHPRKALHGHRRPGGRTTRSWQSEARTPHGAGHKPKMLAPACHRSAAGRCRRPAALVAAGRRRHMLPPPCCIHARDAALAAAGRRRRLAATAAGDAAAATGRHCRPRCWPPDPHFVGEG